MRSHFESEQWLKQPVRKVFAWFADPHNLARIMPLEMDAKLLDLKLVTPKQSVADAATPLAGAGTEMTLSFRLFPGLPLRGRWVARITECEIDHFFADLQVKGPFRYWHHRHEFVPRERNGVVGTLVRDVVDYEVGWGVPGRAADRRIVRRQLARTFGWRQHAVEQLLGGRTSLSS